MEWVERTQKVGKRYVRYQMPVLKNALQCFQPCWKTRARTAHSREQPAARGTMEECAQRTHFCFCSTSRRGTRPTRWCPGGARRAPSVLPRPRGTARPRACAPTPPRSRGTARPCSAAQTPNPPLETTRSEINHHGNGGMMDAVLVSSVHEFSALTSMHE